MATTLRIYITGATGYLGLNLVAELLKNTVLDELMLLVLNEERKAYIMMQLNSCLNEELLSAAQDKLCFQFGELPGVNLSLEGIDCLVHLAALRGPEICKNRVKDAIDVNIFGTMKLVNEVINARCPRIIYISTQSVYENNPDKPWQETAEPAPAELYAATKYAGEELVKNLAETGLFYMVLRPSRLYGVGPGMREVELPFKFARNIVEGKPLTLNFDGRPKIDLLHVRDMAALIRKIIENENRTAWNQIFNVAAGRPVSLNELVDIYREKAAKYKIGEIEISYPENTSHQEAPIWWLDTSKAKKMLNWNPGISLETGVEEILDHTLNSKNER